MFILVHYLPVPAGLISSSEEPLCSVPLSRPSFTRSLQKLTCQCTMSGERELLPPWATIAPHVILLAVVTTRPPVWPRLVLTALMLCLYYTILAHYTTGQGLLHDYGIGSSVGNWAAGLFLYLWLCDPMKDWRWRGEKVTPSEYPLLKRFYYAACVHFNVRLIGWNSQVANLPPPTASGSRGEFLRHRSLHALRCLLYLDLAESYMHLQPLFPLLGTDAFPTGWRGFVMRFQCLFASYVMIYAMMNLGHLLVVIFSVATGFFGGNLEDWRPGFGNWTDAYTVRRFWGRTWHQSLRRNFTITSRALTNALGFKKGTNASSYTQLYTAFALSGLIHVGGDVMCGPPYVDKSLVFFLANAVAITFEDAVIAMGRRFLNLGPGPTRWMKWVGYIWVVTWFYIVAPLHVDWMLHLPGAIHEELLPFSIVRSYAPSIVIKAMQWTL
ncbi:membrane bound O-acyl transferase family-domain-containing protein [Trametes punicea]|nr:membrane bound O-acyl transferase family-domain-containing protein [Trametes punicea]